jgi:predicted ABC-type ATPase
MKLSEQINEAIGGDILDEAGFPIGTKRKRGDGSTWVKLGRGHWERESDNAPSKSQDQGQAAGSAPSRTAKEALAGQDKPLPVSRAWIDHVPGHPKTTASKYKKDGMYTKERADMHAEIVDDFLSLAKSVPPEQKPVALFMMGITASGKSTIRNGLKNDFGEYGAVESDPDAVKETIPEYQEGVAASAKDSAFVSHDESSEVAGEIGDRALKERKHVIFDGTGKNLKTMREKIEKAQKQGYQLQLMMPHVSPDESKRRADGRAEKAGRYVPHDIIDEAASKVPGNLLQLMNDDVFDDLKLYDHEVLGKPKLMVTKRKGEPPVIHDKEAFDNFKRAAGVNESLTVRMSRYNFATGGNVTEEKKNASKNAPKLMIDPDAFGRSFMKALEKDAEEQKALPKKFKKGEGIMWPLCD